MWVYSVNLLFLLSQYVLSTGGNVPTRCIYHHREDVMCCRLATVLRFTDGHVTQVARIHRRTVQKRSSWPRKPQWHDHSPRARHPGMGSQVGLRKHHYKLNYWRWWNSSWAISNPKDDAVKVLHSISQKSGKTQQWPQDWKVSVFIPIPKKGNAKECSNYRTIALISHASKVILKILQARL